MLTQSLRIRAPALECISSKCNFLAGGRAALRFTQYGARRSLYHPQNILVPQSGEIGLKTWWQCEELLMFVFGIRRAAARDRLTAARLHALSRVSPTVGRSVKEEGLMVGLFALHHSSGRHVPQINGHGNGKETAQGTEQNATHRT